MIFVVSAGLKEVRQDQLTHPKEHRHPAQFDPTSPTIPPRLRYLFNSTIRLPLLFAYSDSFTHEKNCYFPLNHHHLTTDMHDGLRRSKRKQIGAPYMEYDNTNLPTKRPRVAENIASGSKFYGGTRDLPVVKPVEKTAPTYTGYMNTHLPPIISMRHNSAFGPIYLPPIRSLLPERRVHPSKVHGQAQKPLPQRQPMRYQNSEPQVAVKEEEVRLRRHRHQAPQSYNTIKQRALTQRLTVMGRERCGSEHTPEEKVSIAGTTGNLYTVHVKLEPSCDCPHANQGNQCKHIIFVGPFSKLELEV